MGKHISHSFTISNQSFSIKYQNQREDAALFFFTVTASKNLLFCFVLVGVYKMWDISPIDFVGKMKYICYRVFVCSGYKKKQYSQIFLQHTYVCNVCSKCNTEQKRPKSL